ncbi:hypothetical protein ABZU76_48580 [Amycolatopsis sp. NPDC005232]|uniref:hypothetical protein n=1 Tax=Amycolatopsis sp. NPDC005232 TaxID=3157027 RepID=UPI0033A9BE94
MRLRTELLLVTGGLVLFAAPAQAAPIGGLVVTPGEGQDASSIRMHTSAGCPADADAYYANLRGKGMPAAGQVVVANTDVGMSHTGGFDVFLAQTLKDYAKDNGTTLSGTYDVTLYCIDSFSQESKGEFTAELKFESAVKYAALGAAKGPNRAPETTSSAPPPSHAVPPTSAVPAQPGAGSTPVTLPGSGSSGGPTTSAPAPENVGAKAESSPTLIGAFALVAGVGLVVAAVALAAWVVRRRAR